MKVKKEIKIGLYIVATVVTLYWGVNFLKGRDIFGKSNTFYAVFDNVQGLQQTGQIYMRGLKIGTVESIRFDEPKNDFVVKLSIDSKYNITLNSVATIYSIDLLGSKAIKIDLGSSDKFHVSGDTLTSAIENDLTAVITTELTPIKNKVSDLLDRANTTLESLNKVLNEEATINLSRVISNVNGITENLNRASRTIDALLAGQRGSIETSLSNIESVSGILKNNEGKITNLLTNLSNISDSLAKANFVGMAGSIDSLLAKLNAAQGTMGKLLNDEQLYNNLTSVTASLDSLLTDVKAHPKRYVQLSVFGKKDN